MAAEQASSSRPVVFTENSPIDVVKAISRDQSVSTGRTSKAFEVVNVALCSHYHLTGWYRLSAGTASSTVSKQPDVVVLAEDHAPFAVAGAAVLSKLGLAAGALEATCVPVALHRKEQESVRNTTSTSCARPARCPTAAAHHRHRGHLHPTVHHSSLQKEKCSCCYALLFASDKVNRTEDSRTEDSKVLSRRVADHSVLWTDRVPFTSLKNTADRKSVV